MAVEYTSVIANKHAFAALKEDGTVAAWGYSSSGGDAPAGLSDVKTIYSTYSAFAALKENGTVVAWGSSVNGGSGVPGGLSDVKAIYSNEYAFTALKEDGTVAAWGAPWGGGSAPALTNVKTIYCTAGAFAALKENGTVVAWGHPGNGGGAPAGLSDVKTIYSNKKAFAALKQDGTVVAWGHSGYGGSTPEGLNDVAIISYGNYFYNGQYHSSTVPIPRFPQPVPTCFPAGTPIQTDQGVTSIEQLVPGEHTLRGKNIIAITQTRPLQKHIVCFEKDSIGKNVPSQQTLCSKEHKVLYRGEMIKARDLADMCKNVKKVSYNGETLYNVLLEKHSKMLVNNMICETLHPENISAKFAKSNSPSKRVAV